MIRSFPDRLRNFARDRHGVSAVEFAIIAPMMVGLYLGSVEISNGIGIDRKVTLTAGAIANLSAQVATISSDDMTDILKAGTAIMAPYSTGPLKITISCISIDGNKTAKVKWSETKNGTKRSTGSTITLPPALDVANTQLLFSEVSYAYQPTIGYAITGKLTLSDTMYMSPRISAPTYGDGSSAKACT
jgi:Flp pilus assembly protein TadG